MNLSQRKRLLSFCFIGMLCCFGCSKKEAASSPTQNNKEVMVQKDGWKEPMVANIEQGKKYTAVIKTEKGDVVCELFADAAPLSVTNFKYLADGEFYNGLTFHRVVPNFVIQGGDPTGTGSGGPGYTIKAEIGKSHPKGALAWARTPDEVNPERKSNGSQFYITLEPTPFLDGQYTVFGQVVSGMNVVEKIAMGDKIVSVTVKAE